MSKETFLHYTQISSPLGNILAASSDEGVVLIVFEEKDTITLRLKKIAAVLQAELQEGENEPLKKLRGELEAYFAGELKVFTSSLQLIGTDFQKKVWMSLAAIAYGDTSSYAEQALRLGKPSSIRAVANANARNPISIILPCHRVIGSDGSLKGYAGGIDRKKYLLDFESKV